MQGMGSGRTQSRGAMKRIDHPSRLPTTSNIVVRSVSDKRIVLLEPSIA